MEACNKFTDKNHETRICNKCGNAFGCGMGGKCWCYEISLDEKALKEIEDQYQGCLCPECLTAISLLSL